MRHSTPDHTVALGVFLAIAAVYVMTSPGRIDIVDAQSRYGVAHALLLEGEPRMWDPVIGFMAVPGRDNLPYAYYGAAGSVFGMPLVGLGLLLGDSSEELPRFLFSLTTPLFGAFTAVVLYLFFRRLDVRPRAAVLWTFAAALTTLLWPGSVTSFDNAQHGFFVLAAMYLGFVSARQRSTRIAAFAGLVGGTLMLYQEYFALAMPALALATLDASVDGGRVRVREGSVRRYFAFGVASTVGLALALGYNEWRFDSWFETGKLYNVPDEASIFGNPAIGLLTLLVSPGKSIFLYSPPIILGVARIRGLWCERPALVLAILGATVTMMLFYAAFRFVGGDWCWGPRYLLVVLPLWALPFPFVVRHTPLRRRAVMACLGAGLAVQLLAISVEHQRFFFARGLEDAFWEDSWVYFRQSALFSRPHEVLALAEGPPDTAQGFGTIAGPGWSTYSILGPAPGQAREFAPHWMSQFKIFYLPRPWPLWMWAIDAGRRPVNIPLGLAALLAIGAAGVLQIREGLEESVPT